MKLVSIINAWADTIEFLPLVIENHLAFADAVIVVWSKKSNVGNVDDRIWDLIISKNWERVIWYQHEPSVNLRAVLNETRKRNIGLDVARKHGFDHFLIADADEFYVTSEVEREKKRFEKPIKGLVCGLKVYVKKPTLFTDDTTLIPFIHKLTDKIKCGPYHNYPFSHNKKTAMIDPSRRLNVETGIHWSEITMHHFSYVRKDISMKINNSSANLRKSEQVIHRDLRNAAPGYKSEMYNRKLEECDNKFNIPIW